MSCLTTRRRRLRLGSGAVFLAVVIVAACAAPSPTVPTAPTASAAPTIAGEIGPTDAPVPARVAGVPNASVDDIAEMAFAFGLECRSFAQAPEMGAAFALDCRREDAGVASSVIASYWAPDYVDSVISVVVSSADGAVPAGHAEPMFRLLAERLLGEAAATQVTDHIDDLACADGCATTLGATTMTITVGVNGARQLNFSPAE